jgi:hypothetical protein
MTTTLHPSGIAFVCPPWCERQAEHMRDLGDLDGRAHHSSPDRTGGPERGWAVALSSMTYPDGTPVDDGACVNVEVPDVDLTPGQARELVAAINAAILEAERSVGGQR